MGKKRRGVSACKDSKANRRSSEKIRAIFASLAEGVIVTDLNRRIVLINEAAEKIFGKPRAGAIGKDIMVFLGPAGRLFSALKDVLEDENSRSFIGNFGGKVLNISLSPFKNSQGSLDGAILVISDVTALERERGRTEAVLENSPDGLLLFDRDDQLTYLNPAAEAILGVKGSEAIGKSRIISALLGGEVGKEKPLKCWESLSCDQSECPAYNSSDLRCWLYSGTYCQGEKQGGYRDKIENCQACEVFKKNVRVVAEPGISSIEEVTLTEPELKILKVRTNPILDGAGNFLGHVKTLQDVTAERKIDQMKNEFVSTVSHELRTPLTSIKGYIDLILEGDAGDINDLQREFLDIVKQNNDRLVALINDLLDISRIESGRVHLKIKPVRLEEIIDEIVATFRAMVERKTLKLKVAVPNDLPAVAADHDRIAQVMANFLSNAIKFTPAGGKISIHVEEQDGQLATSVVDTGIGIPPADQRNLFTKFYRVDSSLTREIGGSGLGLSICKTIVDLHGGRVWVDSEVGKGSTFSFSLPLALKEAKAEELPIEKILKPGKRILVVDDEPDIAKLIQLYLEKEGYSVIKAFDGEEALRIARKEKPDLITLDIMMEKMDGFEVLHCLKEDPVTEPIPVVILSIVSGEHKGYRLGASDYLPKPINPERLTKVIRNLLGEPGVKRKKKKVLIVDDERDIVNLMSRVLEEKGYATCRAFNGLEAIKAVSKEKPDLVLLDLKMPEMDGYQVIERLKGSEATCQIPIVVLTAYELDPAKTKILNLAEEHLSKSFSMETLASKIEEIVEGG